MSARVLPPSRFTTSLSALAAALRAEARGQAKAAAEVVEESEAARQRLRAAAARFDAALDLAIRQQNR